jgi:hypothetical protein
MIRIDERTRFAVSALLCILPFIVVGTCSALDVEPLTTRTMLMCLAAFTSQGLGMLLFVTTMDRRFDLRDPKG